MCINWSGNDKSTKKDDRISIHLESIAICKTFSANSISIFLFSLLSPPPSSTILAPPVKCEMLKCESHESKSWFNLHKKKEELKCVCSEEKKKKKIPCPHIVVIKSLVTINFRSSHYKFRIKKVPFITKIVSSPIFMFSVALTHWQWQSSTKGTDWKVSLRLLLHSYGEEMKFTHVTQPRRAKMENWKLLKYFSCFFFFFVALS